MATKNMAPKQTKAVSITACTPKIMNTVLSQSKLIKSIRFFCKLKGFPKSHRNLKI